MKIRVNNPEYWKRYIEVASEGAVSVSEAAEGLQFFYIKGGFEGFLQKSHAGKDASTANWDDREGTTDINDALVIFDKKGGFLAVAQTAIPNYYPRTAQYIPSWDKLPVFTYQNQKYGYQGLFVLDDYKYAGKNTYWIDFHHAYITVGCIEIVRLTNGSGKNVDADQFIRWLNAKLAKTTVNYLLRTEPKPTLIKKELRWLGTMHLVGDWSGKTPAQEQIPVAPFR